MSASWIRAALPPALGGALIACSNGAGDELSEAARSGQRTYQNACIACHHVNPNREGTLGPAVAGSDLELLDAKVLRGEYPPGYTPKAATGVMPAYTYVEDQLSDLAAYLAEAAEKPGP